MTKNENSSPRSLGLGDGVTCDDARVRKNEPRPSMTPFDDVRVPSDILRVGRMRGGMWGRGGDVYTFVDDVRLPRLSIAVSISIDRPFLVPQPVRNSGIHTGTRLIQAWSCTIRGSGRRRYAVFQLSSIKIAPPSLQQRMATEPKHVHRSTTSSLSPLDECIDAKVARRCNIEAGIRL